MTTTTSSSPLHPMPASTVATTTTTTVAAAGETTTPTTTTTVSTTTRATPPATAPLGGSHNNTRPRRRHSKRHSNWYDYNNENSTALEWENPCGGHYEGGAAAGGGGRTKRKNTTQVFNFLKKSVGNEYSTLSSRQEDIDISNIQIWSLHEYAYKFLPKMKANSTIALKRWYRNVQTYVASFAYLRRVQMRWDYSKSQRHSRTARELNSLLLSSQHILCALETAINKTQPAQRQGRPQPHLQPIGRAQMNRRLKLRTKRSAERSPGALHEADTIDLKFVKHYYYEFLNTMWKVLRRNLKRKGQVALHTRANAHPGLYNEVTKGGRKGSARRSQGRKKRQSQRTTTTTTTLPPSTARTTRSA